MDKYAQQALDEYNSGEKTVRRCGAVGKPFWNIHASQFMFVPQFLFPALPGAKKYIYAVTDCNGKEHTFEANTSTEALTPIWKDIPVGYATVKVEAVHNRDEARFLIGARTFYKSAPFPGRSNLPPRARSYKDCALLAFAFLFKDEATQYWLKHGCPDPNYYHNVYPSKMISAIVKAMIGYAKVDPSVAEEAMQLARNAADYLLSITYPESSPMRGLPPTYSFQGLNRAVVNATAPMAKKRENTLMSFYPADVGNMYLQLEKATGEKKYLDAARRIAEYYQATVLENGSWYLLFDITTGKNIGDNVCIQPNILHFLTAFRNRTGEECWRVLENNYFTFLKKTCLDQYNWEGQFEDIALTGYYQNLTHFTADRMIAYVTKNFPDDPNMIREAEELMRYVEDQFVVWGEFAPWNQHKNPTAVWYSPAGLEQYTWHVPIDSSTAEIMSTFLNLYAVTKDELLLEKACALGDSITRRQNPENGVIPTHWMKKDCAENLENFWINCHIHTAFQMLYLAEVVGEV